MTTTFITIATQKQTDTPNSPRQRCERLRIAADRRGRRLNPPLGREGPQTGL